MYPWSANPLKIFYHQVLKNDHDVHNYETGFLASGIYFEPSEKIN